MADRENPYSYGKEELEWFERFTLRPVPPDVIRERLAEGVVLETMDIPEYLARSLQVDADTGLALYRLTQLFGTPNVPGLEAGADQPDRFRTTWMYLFEVDFEGTEDEPSREFYLAVYDWKTEISTGLSGFPTPDRSPERSVREPAGATVESVEVPDDEFLVGIVQLVLNMVEEPVPATFKELWV